MRTTWVWMLLVLAPALGCARMSESIEDETAGLNGGFEVVRSGLPVNWQVYSPATVPTGDFELIFDRDDFKEGRQSLEFVVRECSADGGWYSPGIANEYTVIPGESYRISFWVRNEGCEYVVTAGAVSAKTGLPESVDTPDEAAGRWRRVEHVLTVPETYDRIRFELSIRSPGRLWLDDVKIEPVDPRPS